MISWYNAHYALCWGHLGGKLRFTCLCENLRVVRKNLQGLLIVGLGLLWPHACRRQKAKTLQSVHHVPAVHKQGTFCQHDQMPGSYHVTTCHYLCCCVGLS